MRRPLALRAVARGGLAALILLGLTVSSAPALGAPDGDAPGYWRQYGLHYAVIGGSGLALGLLTQVDPNDTPLIGPDVPASGPAPAEISQPFAQRQRVSETAMAGVLVGGLAASALIGLSDAGQPGDHRGWSAHDGALGYVEMLTVTLALTELSKVTVGRLRPDYASRCPAGDTQAGCRDGSLLKDGRKSFFSGHSATAFGTATYLALQLGGRLIWRDGTTTGARVGASAGALAVLGGASYVVWSRLADNRHHPLDVTVGGLVGAGVASAVYFCFFDTDGHRRRGPAGTQVGVQPTAGGALLGASGTF